MPKRSADFMDEMEDGPQEKWRKRGTPLSKKQIAQMIDIRIKQMWPRSKYGTAHLERGLPETIQQFGSTWRKANADQRANRSKYGYTGRGIYSGRGYYRR